MEIIKQKIEDHYALSLKGDMTIYFAMENKVALEPHFAIENNISLDMSEVSEFDSTGFQMLLLMERQLHRNGFLFNISKSSSAVQEVLSLYKKTEWLN